MSYQLKAGVYRTEGSVTVFLTILFLLFFSLIGVAFEHVRILSCEGYLRVAAHSAAMTVFGDYNKELYEDYGLFAYGGCDGKTADDLADDFLEIFLENLQYAPENAVRSYGNLYRLQDISVCSAHTRLLTDKEVFLKQVDACLKSNAIEDISGCLLNKQTDSVETEGIQDKLSLTKDYEEGRFDDADEENAKTEIKADETEDVSGGNPLEVFKDLMRDGVLDLVCNSSALSEGIVSKREEEQGKADNALCVEKKSSAAEYFSDIIGNSQEETGQTWEREKKTPAGLNKLKYIVYGNEQFSCYTEDKGRTTKYGLEYLLAGKTEEKDNLLHVVNKLIRIRLLANFITMVADASLQQKSMATATALAGFTGMPPVIYAVQYVILLILAFEEACVDVTALLDGRAVPFAKAAADLKVRYEEICLVSKSFFRKKAAEYSKTGNGVGRNVTYKQYLWTFLLGEAEESLYERSLDLIQHDLREKYNQTFRVKTSIYSNHYMIRYEVPFLFEKLPLLSKQVGVLRQEMEVRYGYKSR